MNRTRHALTGALLFLPAFLVIGGFIFFPVGYSTWLSLTNKHTIRPTYDFIGLGNYVELATDGDYWWSVWRGAIFASGSIVLQILLGLGAALLLHQPFRGRGLVRAASGCPGRPVVRGRRAHVRRRPVLGRDSLRAARGCDARRGAVVFSKHEQGVR